MAYTRVTTAKHCRAHMLAAIRLRKWYAACYWAETEALMLGHLHTRFLL